MANNILTPVWILTASLVLSCGLAVDGGELGVETVTLKALCANKPVKLVKISQVLNVIEVAKYSTSITCDKYKNSFLSLEDLLITVQTGQTCDLEFVAKIKKYHNAFIGSDRPTDEKLNSIPKGLRRFFIGLAFQISAACKINLINNLENDTRSQLTSDDYATIGYLEEKQGTLIDESEKIKDFDDVIRMEDLEEDDGNNDLKMLIKMKTVDFVKKLQETCLNKFKPFYSKLILPLVELSHIGYNYQGELLSRELEELSRNVFVKRWYNIVQTCESFQAIELYYDLGSKSTPASQLITFITRQEADLLRAQNLQMIPELDIEGSIRYEPAPSHNSDELWILQQENVESLISKHKATVKESKRVRARLLRRLFERLVSILKNSLFKLPKGHDEPKLASDSGSTAEVAEIGSEQTAKEILTKMEKTIEDEEASVGN